MDSIPADGLSIAQILQKIADTPHATGNQELIDPVINYLKLHKQDYTRFDAIRWIHNMQQTRLLWIQRENEKFIQENSALIVKSQKEIQHLGLIKYLNQYGIPLNIAKRYLKELKIHKEDIKKDFYVLGFKNEENGFEIRNPFIKGCIGQKNISFIRGTNPKAESIHLFKSFWDYLSLLSHLNTTGLGVDCIVLNSFSCLNQVVPYIQNYHYSTVYTWMDNYALGEQVTCQLEEFFNLASGLKHIPMNRFYSPHIDVSRWYLQLTDNN